MSPSTRSPFFFHALRRAATRAGGVLTLGALLLAAAAPVQAQSTFNTTYRNGSSYKIYGKEPSATGKYPLYVHTTGTGEAYDSAWAKAALDAAVARGFVAATVEYDNATFGSCNTISGRAKGIFDATNANSAVAKLCARGKVDCSKGIATGGLSQGSIISVLSRNYEPRVRASMGQGTGSTYTAAYNLASCMADGKHTQPGDRIRIINGERDMFVGGTEAIARSQAELVTGLQCAGQQSCFRKNGSGWYIVKDREVADLNADHCFMGNLGAIGVQCSGILAVDPYYEYGSGEWGVKATMNWLKTFVTP
ncbi:hypothetical protein [Paracidovorax sp. MALMAid1276]|uniref:hypothetical protein n=1 Tax=Paracidovorax sp. MALMAid1276 TaxID=3411631 RepID=UPI003B9B8A78